MSPIQIFNPQKTGPHLEIFGMSSHRDINRLYHMTTPIMA